MLVFAPGVRGGVVNCAGGQLQGGGGGGGGGLLWKLVCVVEPTD